MTKRIPNKEKFRKLLISMPEEHHSEASLEDTTDNDNDSSKATTSSTDDGENRIQPRYLNKLIEWLVTFVIDPRDAIWDSKREKAIKYLKALHAPVADKALQELIAKELTLKPFYGIGMFEFARVCRDFFKVSAKKSLSITPPFLNPTYVKKLYGYNGYSTFGSSQVYLNEEKSVKNTAETLVHEIVHLRDPDTEHFNETKPAFRSEYRARLAELMLSDKPLTRKRCRELKEFVIKNVEMTDPQEIKQARMCEDILPFENGETYYDAPIPNKRRRIV